MDEMFIKLARVEKTRFLCAISTKEVLKFYTTDMKGFSDFRKYGKTKKAGSIGKRKCLLQKEKATERIFCGSNLRK